MVSVDRLFDLMRLFVQMFFFFFEKILLICLIHYLSNLREVDLFTFKNKYNPFRFHLMSERSSG